MNNIMLLLSGGIDSFFVNLLLYAKQLKIIGIYMQNWEEENSLLLCSYEFDIFNIINIGQKLNVLIIFVNFFSKYWDLVFKFFLKSYYNGYVLNPDIFCNKHIKFGVLINFFFNKINIFISGHYSLSKCNKNYNCFLLTSLDTHKDQSYFLSYISKTKLLKVIFILGKFLKIETKNFIYQYKFYLHIQKESMGICFIGTKKFNSFIKIYIKITSTILLRNEYLNIIGSGLRFFFFVTGTRRGLFLFANHQINYLLPWFTGFTLKDKKNVIVLQGNKHIMFFQSKLNFFTIFFFNSIIFFSVFMHFTDQYQKNRKQIILKNQRLYFFINLFNKDKIMTKGQSFVFYKKIVCLGNSTIL